jgi:hypothetical protein
MASHLGSIPFKQSGDKFYATEFENLRTVVDNLGVDQGVFNSSNIVIDSSGSYNNITYNQSSLTITAGTSTSTSGINRTTVKVTFLQSCTITFSGNFDSDYILNVPVNNQYEIGSYIWTFEHNPINNNIRFHGGISSDGLSAYQIAQQNGFTGTEQEWLDSLEGTDGDKYNTVSLSSNSIPSSHPTQVTFTVDVGLAYSANQSVVLSYDVSNYFIGDVVSYNFSDGTLIVDSTSSIGSGTYSSWDINLGSATGATGPAGADGNTILNGTVDPTTEGVDGDFYLNTTSSVLFGPKAAGSWPGSGTSLIGADGVDGLDGNTILNGTSDPTTEGVNGDFYLNTNTNTIFGPKSGGTWQSGTSLVGPTGASGSDGADGADGSDGNTILNGTIDPTTEGVDGDFYYRTDTQEMFGPKATTWPAGVGISGTDGTNGTDGTDGNTVLNGTVDPTTEGVDGDFYINTTSDTIFGPKSTTWPSGVSLVGPTGSDGADGVGMPAGGVENDVVAKNSGTNYDFKYIKLINDSDTQTEGPTLDFSTAPVLYMALSANRDITAISNLSKGNVGVAIFYGNYNVTFNSSLVPALQVGNLSTNNSYTVVKILNGSTTATPNYFVSDYFGNNSSSGGILQNVQDTWISSSILNGNTTPLAIVSSPGADNVIRVLKAYAYVHWQTGRTAYATNTTLALSSGGVEIATCDILGATAADRKEFTFVDGIEPEPDSSLVLSVKTGDPTAGTSHVGYGVEYVINNENLWSFPAYTGTPGAPTAVSGTVNSSTQITVGWTAPASDGGSAITGYKIERNLNQGGFSTIVSNTGNTNVSYVDSTLNTGDDAQYRISAINANGTGPASTASTEVTTWTIPGAPTSLTATTDVADVDLVWVAPADNGGTAITGYKIEINTDSGGWGTHTADTGNTNVTYTDVGPGNGTHEYRVSAINSVGTGSPSNIDSATVNVSNPTAVANINDWLSTSQVNSLSFTVGAGTNRYLIGIVNHEGTSGDAGAVGATYGGVAMTLLLDTLAFNGWNACQIWGLNEAGIQAAVGTTFTTSGTVGDTPNLAMAAFEGVHQTTSVRSSGFDDSADNPEASPLTINTNDMIVFGFATTAGLNITSYLNDIATPDSTFNENLTDDPSEGGYKAYAGSNTTTGSAKVNGGEFNRTAFNTVILALN